VGGTFRALYLLKAKGERFAVEKGDGRTRDYASGTQPLLPTCSLHHCVKWDLVAKLTEVTMELRRISCSSSLCSVVPRS
jgi:hypothetical protein